MSDRSQLVPDETRRYEDGWPVRADDGLAEALYRAACEPEATGLPPFGELEEWQRDDYRQMAQVAREWIATEMYTRKLQ